MTTKATDLDELRRLDSEATKGPWEYDPASANQSIPNLEHAGSIRETDGHYWIAMMEIDGPRPKADAALIVALRDALPGLLETIDELHRDMEQVSLGAKEARERQDAEIERLTADLNQTGALYNAMSDEAAALRKALERVAASSTWLQAVEIALCALAPAAPTQQGEKP